mgnify:FL=1
MAEAALVALARSGNDPDAFGELVRRYQTRVFRLVVSILGQEFAADAEDVAQDVFVRAHGALGSYRGDAAFGTWIYRIAFNLAISVKARIRFRVPHVPDGALASHVSTGPSPDATLEQQRRQAAVLACVHELPEVYQSVIRLHYWTGTSVGEIAELLDMPENTVKSYLYRARKLLQARLVQRGVHA